MVFNNAYHIYISFIIHTKLLKKNEEKLPCIALQDGDNRN